MANTSRKHNRQKRSASGKSQPQRTAANKARRAARTARRREKAKAKPKIALICTGQRTWVAAPEGQKAFRYEDSGMLVTGRSRSEITKMVMQKKKLPSSAIRREIPSHKVMEAAMG